MEKRGTVFILDDDFVLLELYRHFLEKHGFDVFATDNAYKLILYAREMKPDLFILDLNMPEVSGWEVVRYLKQERRLMHIPIVILTIRRDKKMPSSYHVAFYLRKPMERIKLLDVVEAYTEGGQQHDVLFVTDYGLPSLTLREELKRRKIDFFEVYDVETACLYLSKNKPKVVALGFLEEKSRKVCDSLFHYPLISLKNERDINNLELFFR